MFLNIVFAFIMLVFTSFVNKVEFLFQNISNRGENQQTTTPTPSPTPSTLKYISSYTPASLNTKYIKGQEWPPQLTTIDESYSCDSLSNSYYEQKEVTVGKSRYCIATRTGAAAGTVYKMYSYKTVKDSQLVVVLFTLGYPQCGNYPQPQQSECSLEENGFNVDQMVDNLVQSIKFE